MGVWIETCRWCADRIRLPVTPCMGVWIETSLLFARGLQVKSHPVWVCGLKQIEFWQIFRCYPVRPCMGVWIETWISLLRWKTPNVTPCMGVWIETQAGHLPHLTNWVTPCMGVWIETGLLRSSCCRTQSHTLYGCVDWNRKSLTSFSN